MKSSKSKHPVLKKLSDMEISESLDQVQSGGGKDIPNKLDHRFQNKPPGNRDLLEKGAILQRDGTYAIAPHIPGGIITDPDLLIKIATVAKKYNLPAVKITSAQRIALVGLKENEIDSAWADLGMDPGAAIGLCVRRIKFCPGTTFCKRGLQDSVGLGGKLDQKYHGMSLPNKFKISVSGCPRKCMDTLINDFGFMGTAKGWTVYVGGSGGINPRFAEILAENVTEEEGIQLLDRSIEWYKANAKTNERIGSTIERIGFDKFKSAVTGPRH
ncbi:NAD(P)H-nitrite reductase large subunit [Desulfohalotomaculum tongense]|uniref:NAD(P)/FAD-dependent oxidoreductase n=1 Tax=Desulforadius tongensis TaxID=1216062 RepID=UPI001EE5ED36|nr:NAD(P)/FAD-dependent oxidoreductase [Desulforadius tongensis]MBM7854766.1 NAD(P)H-nitrite reductase large subunit [Desulforadius tongensis]